MPKVALCLALLTLAACGSAASPSNKPNQSATPAPTPKPVGSGESRLTGILFTANYKSTWHVTNSTQGSALTYSLSSQGELDTYGLPPAGGIGITVGIISLANLSQQLGSSATSLTNAQLEQVLVGEPPGILNASVNPDYPKVTLAGEATAGYTYTYTYKGTDNVQEDIVLRHGGYAITIELDAAPTVHDAQAALQKFLDSWVWTAPPPAAPRASASVGPVV